MECQAIKYFMCYNNSVYEKYVMQRLNKFALLNNNCEFAFVNEIMVKTTMENEIYLSYWIGIAAQSNLMTVTFLKEIFNGQY